MCVTSLLFKLFQTITGDRKVLVDQFIPRDTNVKYDEISK